MTTANFTFCVCHDKLGFFLEVTEILTWILCKNVDLCVLKSSKMLCFEQSGIQESALNAVSLSSAFLLHSARPDVLSVVVPSSSRLVSSLYHTPSSKRVFSFPCFYKRNPKCVSVVWCGSPYPFLNQQLWSMRWRFWVTIPGCGSRRRGGVEGELALLECMFWKRRRD